MAAQDGRQLGGPIPREYKFTDEDRQRSREKEQTRRNKIAALPKQFDKEDKETTHAAFGYQCGYCGAPETDVRLEFDHYIDLYAPDCPGTVCGNMVPSCRPCNRKKGNHGADTILDKAKEAEVVDILRSLGAPF